MYKRLFTVLFSAALGCTTAIAQSAADAIRNATGVSINCCPITPHVLYREFKQAGLIEE